MEEYLSRKDLIAQGTIEYLIIVGVVVIIGLVVVSLTTNLFDDTQNIFTTSTRISSTTGIISINEAVVNNDGNGLISFSNNSGETLTITSLNVGGNILDYPDTVLVQGTNKVFGLNDLNDSCSCTGFEGKTRICNVTIYYTSQYGLEKQFSTNVSVDCIIGTVTTTSQISLIQPIGSDEEEPSIHLCGELSDLPEYSEYIIINDCSEISFSGNYILSDNLNCSTLNIDVDEVNINGNYCTLTGNITANSNRAYCENPDPYCNYSWEYCQYDCGSTWIEGEQKNFGLDKININGSIISTGENGLDGDMQGGNGASSGTITINDSTILNDINSIGGNGGNAWEEGGNGASSGTIIITNTTVLGTINSFGGNGGNGDWASGTGGSAGTITLDNIEGLTEINAIGGNSFSTAGKGGDVIFVIPCPDVIPTINVSGGNTPAHCSYNDSWCNESENTCVDICGGAWLPASTGESGTISPPEGMCNAKVINDFRFTSPPSIGVINEESHTISLTVSSITDRTSLVPTIDFIGLSINPLNEIANNFTNPTIYTVTSADNSTQDYTITVNPLSVYGITLNLKDSFTNEHLTGINIDCNANIYDLNDNAYDSTNQNSPKKIDFDQGTYLCTFSKTNYDSNTMVITVDNNDSINIHLNPQSFPEVNYPNFSSCGTLSVPDGNYVLENNIGFGSACIRIGANNIKISGGNNTITGDINSTGSGVSSYTGLKLENLILNGRVISTGLGGNGSTGGSVTATNCILSEIYTIAGGGSGWAGGAGGAVILNNSSARLINTKGGDGGYYYPANQAGPGGNVTINDSNILIIIAIGGIGSYMGGVGGNGGEVTFNICPNPTPDVNVDGGYGPGGYGTNGTITPSDCHDP
ncbi:MAG: hypothetical protein PHP82_03230 [Candidatus ainarchaeum sp.]|nr:hypothetical protein [Candidatus ainarchaeum sp.]